jgi:glycosyltransferase involved in cell wall biosynthesis
MASYNGENYIELQMDSIRKQTIQADEVIICDDRSTDNTVNIVRNYIRNYGLEDSWKIIANSNNKGFINNFIDAIDMATKEIIFFSDQDDIWDNNKIASFLTCFEEVDADAIFCLADSIDPEGKMIANKLALMNRIPSKESLHQVSLTERLKYGRSPGLCLGFKQYLVPEIRRVSSTYKLPHDLPVGLIAATNRKYYLLNTVLVHHRIHMNNVSSPDTNIIKSAYSLEKQKQSRQIKIHEIQAVLSLYGSDSINPEMKMLKQALSINELALEGLKEKSYRKLLRAFLRNNAAVNKLLILRNIMSLIINRQ